MKKDIDVLILAGGFGTRLRPVFSDVPKVLVPMGDRLFVDILIDQLVNHGFYRITFCIGYLKEQVIDHLKKRNDCQISFSSEESPLGTAGAIKNAEKGIQSDTLIVLNGDSYCKADFSGLLEQHLETDAFATIALVLTQNAEDYGSVQLAEDGRTISAFQEKIKGTNSFINAGIYCMNRSVLNSIPSGKKLSIEYDVFPRLVGNGFLGYQVQGPLLDIGTPERYNYAIQHLEIFT